MKKVSNENQMFLFGDLDTAVIERPPAVLKPIVKAIQAQLKAAVFFLSNQLDVLVGKGCKVKANLDAIELLKTRRGTLTDAEKSVLVKYTGWGGAASVFDLDGQDAKQAEKLKGMLTEQEYASARSSVLNAYFTEPFVIRAMWGILESMGFKGGKVLETSAGVGHFVGAMPENLRANSHITMVEPDRVSAAILNRVYDESELMVFNTGLEKAPLRSGSFDVAISNVPFGQYKVNDVKFNPLKLMIHDYFFAKALDLVRPGGVVAFITSTGTLDKSRQSFRAYLSEKADLVTAIRLPTGTFGRLGETDVVTDIVVLRKKPAAPDGKKGMEFVRNMRIPRLGEVGGYYLPNEAFNHGAVQIGCAKLKTGKFGLEVEIVGKASQLATVTQALEPELQGWYQAASAEESGLSVLKALPGSVTSGYFLTESGEVGYITPDGNSESCSHLPAKSYERLSGMVRIRDATRALIENDVAGLDTAAQRIELGGLYDSFVRHYGNLLSDVNRRIISLDSYAPLLWSLERFDEEREIYSKAEIFSRCTISKAVLIETAGSMADAISLSYNRFGKIEIDFMASALSWTKADVVKDLLETGRAMLEPGTDAVVDAEEYLSGNVRLKLDAALSAAERDTRFEKNVQALQEVLPLPIPIKHINVRLGAPWVSAEDIEWFVREVPFERGENLENVCTIVHSPTMATWKVQPDGSARRNVIATNEWGTERRGFFDLLETALNQQQPTVYDTVEVDGKDRQVVNAEHTTAAREKLEKISDAFEGWIGKDAARAARLEETYNSLFNSVVCRKYDGSHMVIPGLNPAIQLRDAQKDSVWRGIVSGNTLYALAVGGGKTLIQIVLAQESKRLGLATKPCLVVPNHMLEAFAGEYLRAFPRAKVLAASKSDLEGDKRRTLLMRMATGDWDAVIITHSSFGRIAVSRQAMQDFADEVADLLGAAVSEAKSSSESGDVRELERTRKTIMSKMEAMTERKVDSTVLPFEKIGLDLIMVDEADLFKNLWFHTKRTRVAGLPQVASQRAWDLFMKSRLVFKRLGNNQRGLVFATATPVSNTLAEMYTMQRYLQEDALKAANIGNFDAWAANFAREVTSIEVAPDGSGYRMHTRFAQFVNVPELMLMFRQVAEIRTKKMLDLPIPRLEGGKHQIVAIPARPELKEYVDSLVIRADAIRAKQVKPEKDNMLKVTGDGRKAALDMRLIDRDYGDALVTKLNACVNNVYRHWADGMDMKLTQLIFSDLGTPGTDRFSVYTDIRDKLIAKGVPAEEIAFAQDFGTDRQKGEFHRKIRCGKIRIAMGSTELMGFGTNVQDLLICEHHIDVPWRPRDIEQRDGRIERQGNKNPVVYIYRYVTEGSFDAYMWQTNETKAGFIEQLWENNGSARTIEDVSSQALSCAEVKALASGNPLVIEKAGIDAEVAKLWKLRQVYDEGKRSMQVRLMYAQDLVVRNNDLADDAANDLQATKDEDGAVSLVGTAEEVGRAIAGKIRVERAINSDCKRMTTIFTAGAIGVVSVSQWNNVELYVKGPSGRLYEQDAMGGKSFLELYEWATSLRKQFETARQRALNRIETESVSIASMTRQIERQFEYEERLDKAVARQKLINDSLEINQNDKSAQALETEAAV